ncbi:hypothetical protein ABW19_dt0209529 [Dactylella cylindrospora]|nr:hypothetical protein ABW19_dt0209529 [Dactylella cylindrospora]
MNDIKDTVTSATANLSIVLDKVLVFGRSNLNLTDKGYLLEDDSILAFNVERDGRKTRGPAMGVSVGKLEEKMVRSSDTKAAEADTDSDKTPRPTLQAKSMLTSQFSKISKIGPNPGDLIRHLNITYLEESPSPEPEGADEHKLEEPKQGKPTSEVPKMQELATKVLELVERKKGAPKVEAPGKEAPKPEAQKPESAQPAKATAVKKDDNTKLGSRCVLITGLPYGFTIPELLNLIKPTKNTLVIEIKMTKSFSGMLHFFKPEGAQDFLKQYPEGYITFEYKEPELGLMEWRAKPQLWGEYTRILPESLPWHITETGATRYLRIYGRKPTTLKDADKLWTLEDYRKVLGQPIYDGKIYFEKDRKEVAVLEFLAIKQSVYARAKFRGFDGFQEASYQYLPDP